MGDTNQQAAPSVQSARKDTCSCHARLQSICNMVCRGYVRELLDISERSAVSVGSFNRMTPDIRKNMAKRFSEINYDELPLDGPDPIRQIINEERKAAGLQEIASTTEPKTLINRLIN